MERFVEKAITQGRDKATMSFETFCVPRISASPPHYRHQRYTTVQLHIRVEYRPYLWLIASPLNTKTPYDWRS